MKLAQYVKRGLSPHRSESPVSLILLITSRCNARCIHCFFAEELNQTPDLMTLDDYRKLSSELNNLCQLYLAGGEPFLRKDLPDICRIFDRNNHVGNVTIPTNGYVVDRTVEAVREVLETCAFDLMVSISIDGTQPRHDAIRKVPGGFDKLCRTFSGLDALRASHPTFRMQVTTTIMNENIDDLPALMTWVRANLPHVSAHNFELVRSRPNEHCAQLPSLDRLRAFERVHRQMVHSGNGYLPESKIKSFLARRMKANLFREAIQVLEDERQVFDCVAGVEMGVVDYKGDVFLCELLPAVGNVLSDGFTAAWHSEAAECQRHDIAAKRCWCTHSCFQSNSNLMNPKSYLKMLR